MPPSLPVLRIRFTAAQHHGVLAGLAPVVWASCIGLINSGDDPETCTCLFCGLHNELLHLTDALGPGRGQGRYRTRLNIVQILLSQVAARNAGNPSNIVRKRFDNLPLAGRHKNLAIKLENLRRRAKRRYQQLYGAAAYEQLRTTWQGYLDSLRQSLSGRPPWFFRRRNKRSLLPFNTLLIDGLIKSVLPRLQQLQHGLPPTAEIRRLTRLFLRYIRRDRLNVSIRDCIRPSDTVAAKLADFIMKRCRNGETDAKQPMES